MPFNPYPNALVPYSKLSQLARVRAWKYEVLSYDSHGGKHVRQGHGEQISDDLRRTIDGVMSGRIKTTDYPSAKEYLEHLDAVLDE